MLRAAHARQHGYEEGRRRGGREKVSCLLVVHRADACEVQLVLTLALEGKDPARETGGAVDTGIRSARLVAGGHLGELCFGDGLLALQRAVRKLARALRPSMSPVLHAGEDERTKGGEGESVSERR